MSRANPAPRAAPPAPPGTLDVEFLYLDLTTCTRCQGTHRTHPRGDRAGAVFQYGGSSPPGRTPRRGAGEPAALLRRRGPVGGGRLCTDAEQATCCVAEQKAGCCAQHCGCR